MASHVCHLVGAHFRPPAKAILAALPSGCALRVVPEPDNPYDENALRIEVASADIPATQHSKLGEEASFFGHDLATILAQPYWHLGYIKATEALSLAGPIAITTDNDPAGLPAILQFDSSGKPLVTFDLPET